MAEKVSAATRDRITDEAARLVRFEPVGSISVQRVAEAAGVTSSSIYKAYGSKYELFAEASRRVLVDQVSEVAQAVDEDAPPLERLRQVLVELLEVCSDQPFAVAYLYGMFPLLHHAEVDDAVRDEVALVDAEVRNRLRHRVADALADDALAPRPAAARVAGAQTGAQTGAETGAETGEGEVDVDELVELCRLAAFGYLGEAVQGGSGVSPTTFAAFVLRALGADG